MIFLHFLRNRPLPQNLEDNYRQTLRNIGTWFEYHNGIGDDFGEIRRKYLGAFRLGRTGFPESWAQNGSFCGLVAPLWVEVVLLLECRTLDV